jgi:nucleoside-diphosphate-sugar epimerase
MKIFLTGANGFVGGVVDARLSTDGHAVTALMRSPKPQREGLEVLGDIAHPPSYLDALADQDAVIHLAARAHVVRETNVDPISVFRAINRDATVSLARASMAAGVKHFVFISSIGVNGNDSSTGALTEESPTRPHQPYALSKYEAEAGLIELAEAGGMAVTIIRPTLIYGPNAPGNMRRLLRLVYKRLPLPLASATAGKSFVGVDNLADLIAASIGRPPRTSQLFLAADDDIVSTASIVGAMGSAMGRPAMLLPMPALAVSLAKNVGPIRGVVGQLFTPLTVDNQHAKKILGWEPRGKTLDGIAEMASRYAQSPW